MKRRILCLILTAIIMLALFVACSESEAKSKDDKLPKSAASEKPETGLAKDGSLSGCIPEEGSLDMSDDYDFGVEAENFADAAVGESFSTTEGGVGNGGTLPDTEIEAGTLTAGEWKDNDNYDFWCSLFEREEWKNYAASWKIIPDMRFAVTLTNGQNAAKNVKVEMYVGEELLSSAVSDSYGKAYLNPHLFTQTPDNSFADLVAADKLVVYFENGSREYPITAEDLAAGGMSINDAEGKKHTTLDLMFVVDTTGSMNDELEYLKKELDNVISTVSKENEGLDISLSLNFYRDEGDEYVVKSNPFSPDIEKSLKILDNEYSDGGGDYPEAVDTALKDALTAHEWREESVKLMFLVLDAPPHRESEEVIDSIHASVKKAAEMGVRIIPIASSGVDTETEFLLRLMASATGGTYTFLTDHSGVGESHLEPTIGDYNVKKLNELLVKIINEYCK